MKASTIQILGIVTAIGCTTAIGQDADLLEVATDGKTTYSISVGNAIESEDRDLRQYLTLYIEGGAAKSRDGELLGQLARSLRSGDWEIRFLNNSFVPVSLRGRTLAARPGNANGGGPEYLVRDGNGRDYGWIEKHRNGKRYAFIRLPHSGPITGIPGVADFERRARLLLDGKTKYPDRTIYYRFPDGPKEQSYITVTFDLGSARWIDKVEIHGTNDDPSSNVMGVQMRASADDVIYKEIEGTTVQIDHALSNNDWIVSVKPIVSNLRYLRCVIWVAPGSYVDLTEIELHSSG